MVAEFDTEAKCRAYLEGLRWPDGVHCPRCNSTRVSRLVGRRQFDCHECRYQFSVTAGTLMHDSHLPLWKWVLAIYLIAESEGGLSANQVKDTIEVSYKTAWHLGHRIRAAMRLAENGDEGPRAATDGWSVVRESVGGPYRHVSAKHLPAYQDEAAFRAHNRANPYRLRDTLERLLRGDALPYRDLVRS